MDILKTGLGLIDKNKNEINIIYQKLSMSYLVITPMFSDLCVQLAIMSTVTMIMQFFLYMSI